MFLQEVNFPDNDGAITLIVKSDESEIKLEYEFNALNNQHYFTITNNGLTLEKVKPCAGCIMNYCGIGICDLFAICYSPLYNGLLGYPEEFVCETAKIIITDIEGLNSMFSMFSASM